MSRTTSKTANRQPLPDTWGELTAALQLRPIHDDAAYDHAVELIDRLAVLDHRTDDQEDFIETLSALVERYDEEHFTANRAAITPIKVLRYLCEQNGLNASALGELLGNRSLGSKVLREERQLSKEHIRRLCDRFSVSSGLFL